MQAENHWFALLINPVLGVEKNKKNNEICIWTLSVAMGRVLSKDKTLGH